MPARLNISDQAARRGRRQLDAVVADLRIWRISAGLSQRAVARALGCSQQLLGAFERRLIDPDPIKLVRWGAMVGLDVAIGALPAGPPLRDAGQLRLLGRFSAAVGDAWTVTTEVPVSGDPREQRAIDTVLARGGQRVGAEEIVRLADVQAEVRRALLKKEAAGLSCIVLVLARTRHNRRAVADAAPTLGPAFPLPPREVMRALRAGEVPRANGLVLV